jgi:hypothetical protein
MAARGFRIMGRTIAEAADRCGAGRHSILSSWSAYHIPHVERVLLPNTAIQFTQAFFQD